MTPSGRPRRIAHLDMDAFYASVELLRRPELRGLPVVIGGRGDPSRRGVVTTASYEARRFGVHSGMALMVAARLCPQCTFLPVDFDAYRAASRAFKAAVREIADVIEDRGIDEIYIDLSALDPDTLGLARRLQARVLERTGLSCSIGIAPNKLLAKIASDLEKPAGITLIERGDLEARIWPLPVRRVNGIGPKADARLETLGVRTIGELAAAELAWLVAHFGARYGEWLHRAAHGIDDRPVVTFSEPKSRSRETTFQEDTRDWQTLAAVLARLVRQVVEDLRKGPYAARTIGVKLRFADFTTLTRERTLPAAVDDEASIRRAAFECLQRIAIDRRVRLIGVRCGELVRAAAHGTGAVAATETAAAMPARARARRAAAGVGTVREPDLFDPPSADAGDDAPLLGSRP